MGLNSNYFIISETEHNTETQSRQIASVWLACPKPPLDAIVLTIHSQKAMPALLKWANNLRELDNLKLVVLGKNKMHRYQCPAASVLNEHSPKNASHCSKCTLENMEQIFPVQWTRLLVIRVRLIWQSSLKAIISVKKQIAHIFITLKKHITQQSIFMSPQVMSELWLLIPSYGILWM